MPAGAVGSCWASGSWSNTCWEANAWADAAALAFVLDMNTRLSVYLRDFYGLPTADPLPLLRRYLEDETSGEFAARFRQLMAAATGAMT